MASRQRHGRFVLIALAGVLLLSGLGAGTVRLGWIFPIPTDQFPIVHGPLMAIGFLGTLIGLERAVALGRVWPSGIPVLTAISALSARRLTGPVERAASGCREPALDRCLRHALPSVP
jgi:hypothetical protein